MRVLGPPLVEVGLQVAEGRADRELAPTNCCSLSASSLMTTRSASENPFDTKNGAPFSTISMTYSPWSSTTKPLHSGDVRRDRSGANPSNGRACRRCVVGDGSRYPDRVVGTLWQLGARFNVRWRVRAWWRARRGLGGDFKRSEISARAADLTTRWRERWPGRPPLAPGEPSSLEDYDARWVRFHSLPESKQWPDTQDERFEILSRHSIALTETVEQYGCAELTVIVQDYNTNDLFGGWTKKHLPGSWPWTSWRDPGDDEDDPFVYYWVAPMTSIGELDELLLLAAEGTGNAMVTDSQMTWLYIPYDGGADVYLPSSTERDEFRDRHPEWRPTIGPGS